MMGEGEALQNFLLWAGVRIREAHLLGEPVAHDRGVHLVRVRVMGRDAATGMKPV